MRVEPWENANFNYLDRITKIVPFAKIISNIFIRLISSKHEQNFLFVYGSFGAMCLLQRVLLKGR